MGLNQELAEKLFGATVRKVLLIGGTYAATKGWVGQEVADTFVSANTQFLLGTAAALIGTGWSYWEKWTRFGE